MAHRDILVSKKKVRPHKAFISPEFNKPTVLVSNHFDYVELWLRKEKSTTALAYWGQARNFYDSTLSIPIESKPLTAYYSMMNAAKALLAAKGISFDPLHGCKGEVVHNKAIPVNEKITILTNGVVPSITRYFGYNIQNVSLNLKTLLYNIPYVHRAFTTTYSDKNLFIPLSDPHFVYQNNGNNAWFTAKIVGKEYQHPTIYQNQRGWEVNIGEEDGYWIRKLGRFKWFPQARNRNDKLVEYHKIVRRDVKYIYGRTAMWYLKRNFKSDSVCNWPIPTMVLMAMHRLSELCRYTPDRLSRHLEGQHNWLLSEFLNLAPLNFIDNIACEITGRNLMSPGYRSAK